MQRFILAGIVLMFISCNSKTEDKPTDRTENWVLTEKNRFAYRLNNLGNPDTTFIYNQKYKDGLVSDSSTSFVVNTWKDGLILKEAMYVMTRNNIPGLLTSTSYGYDAKGRVLSRKSESYGRLISQQLYFYNDTTGGLSRSKIIQLKNYNLVTGKALNLTEAAPNEIGYDTTYTTYQYDQTKKVLGTKFFRNDGHLLSYDTTLYTGNDPLLTVNLSSKGDTLKKVTYEKRGKILMTVTETDSLALFQNLLNGVMIAQKTVYKGRNEQWRSAVLFDPVTGRKTEDNLYKLE
ncbi:MAG: hypothetical protein EOO01_03860 [Chitinophagaceae bacterium]|nr:MAG: hypothetical protein EOO01_03860 [Chitinophagaceae bacterium]